MGNVFQQILVVFVFPEGLWGLIFDHFCETSGVSLSTSILDQIWSIFGAIFAPRRLKVGPGRFFKDVRIFHRLLKAIFSKFDRFGLRNGRQFRDNFEQFRLFWPFWGVLGALWAALGARSADFLGCWRDL